MDSDSTNESLKGYQDAEVSEDVSDDTVIEEVKHIKEGQWHWLLFMMFYLSIRLHF